jgi:hypothetical protein
LYGNCVMQFDMLKNLLICETYVKRCYRNLTTWGHPQWETTHVHTQIKINSNCAADVRKIFGQYISFYAVPEKNTSSWKTFKSVRV